MSMYDMMMLLLMFGLLYLFCVASDGLVWSVASPHRETDVQSMDSHPNDFFLSVSLSFMQARSLPSFIHLVYVNLDIRPSQWKTMPC